MDEMAQMRWQMLESKQDYEAPDHGIYVQNRQRHDSTLEDRNSERIFDEESPCITEDICPPLPDPQLIVNELNAGLEKCGHELFALQPGFPCELEVNEPTACELYPTKIC